jgi:hypothetical protein
MQDAAITSAAALFDCRDAPLEGGVPVAQPRGLALERRDPGAELSASSCFRAPWYARYRFGGSEADAGETVDADRGVADAEAIALSKPSAIGSADPGRRCDQP